MVCSTIDLKISVFLLSSWAILLFCQFCNLACQWCMLFCKVLHLGREESEILVVINPCRSQPFNYKSDHIFWQVRWALVLQICNLAALGMMLVIMANWWILSMLSSFLFSLISANVCVCVCVFSGRTSSLCLLWVWRQQNCASRCGEFSWAWWVCQAVLYIRHKILQQQQDHHR